MFVTPEPSLQSPHFTWTRGSKLYIHISLSRLLLRVCNSNWKASGNICGFASRECESGESDCAMETATGIWVSGNAHPPRTAAFYFFTNFHYNFTQLNPSGLLNILAVAKIAEANNSSLSVGGALSPSNPNSWLLPLHPTHRHLRHPWMCWNIGHCKFLS